MNVLRIATLATTCWIGGLTTLATLPQAVAEEAAAPIQILDEGLPPHWLQGDPVAAMEQDHLYIFEFWATWCGPCIAQMPHLEELYQATKDDQSVSLIGINVFDNTEVDKLKNFIKKQGVTYPVAADGSRKGNVAKKWLGPLGVTGIPHAIAVRNHEILWRGHPSKLNLDLITELKDPSRDAAALEAARLKKQADDKAAERAHFEKLGQIQGASPDQVQSLADSMVAGDHRGPDDIRGFRSAAFNTLFHAGQHVAAQQELAKLADEAPDDAISMIRIGTIIVTTDELENKDLELAVRCLERNIELNPDNASVAYQRITDAKLQMGDRDGAIEAAKLAVEHSRQGKALNAHLDALK
ncbi:TlpA disulfide reductase family protein [Sulfuriroseicoccus oceanibius]|uniref:Redoxin domain-containing protein n=1 Tax=Sulfuriroseicoccus oceanibius TaxID=2707525 RepID=A0A6B3LAS2_9BACT|nr:TlpA disulfide reductase family protein [Sulfuriroseicoccus oceanibius]QQL45204.1 redoxin domain-containing protein [Sulfuriroseicoccus oceanibius]